MPYGVQIPSPPGTATSAPSHQMGQHPPARVMSPTSERSPLHREFTPEGRLPPITVTDVSRGRPVGSSGSRRDTLPPLHIGNSPTPHSPLSPLGRGHYRHPSRSASGHEHSPLYSAGSGTIPRPFTLQPDPIWAADHPIPRPTIDNPGGSPLSAGPALPDVFRSSQSRTPPQTSDNRTRDRHA